MNPIKYKYFDKLIVNEARRCSRYNGWYDIDEYDDINDFHSYENYLNGRYYIWYYEWLDDPRRLRDIKIDELLSDVHIGNIGLKMPKSLFK